MILASNSANVAKAAEVLRSGGVVVAPTGTIMGIVARADCPAAVEKVCALKSRARGKPLLVNAASIAMAARVGIVGAKERELLKNPLISVLLKARGGGRVGVRIPSDKTILSLIKAVGAPLVSTSCNVAGKAPAKDAAAAERLFPKLLILEATGPQTGEASTIVRVERSKVVVVRGASTRRPA